MTIMLRFAPALVLTAGYLALSSLTLQALLAGDKKEPPKEVVVKDQLINADLKDKVRTNMFCKTYTYRMVEGRNYQIDMISTELDSYLRLEDPAGQQIAADDDSGGFPNARILIRAPKNGDYTIVATTFAAGATGKFTLIVKDISGGPAPKEEKKEEKKDKLQKPEDAQNSNTSFLSPVWDFDVCIECADCKEFVQDRA